MNKSLKKAVDWFSENEPQQTRTIRGFVYDYTRHGRFTCIVMQGYYAPEDCLVPIVEVIYDGDDAVYSCEGSGDYSTPDEWLGMCLYAKRKFESVNK